MSVAVTSNRNSGLAAWFEFSSALPVRSASPETVLGGFLSKLESADQELELSDSGLTRTGLAKVFSTESAQARSTETEQRASQIETSGSVWSSQTVDEATRNKIQALFRDVPEDSIEPDNAILLWRRPTELPAISWQSKLVLAEAIRRAGYDPKEFAVSYWESKGEWPGGLTIGRQLTLVAPDGRKIDMGADLIVKCPDAAVADVQRLMSWRPPAPEGQVT